MSQSPDYQPPCSRRMKELFCDTSFSPQCATMFWNLKKNCWSLRMEGYFGQQVNSNLRERITKRGECYRWGNWQYRRLPEHRWAPRMQEEDAHEQL